MSVVGRPDTTPSGWLLAHATLLPAQGCALDVACGRGRHALWLARRGLLVTAVDRDADLLEELSARAREERLPVSVRVCDLESGDAPFEPEAFDVIVVVSYLHRPLFPALKRALRPGGLLFYETFTHEQARIGRPTNPDFLLRTGELEALMDPLEILGAREGLLDGRFTASVVARRPMLSTPA